MVRTTFPPFFCRLSERPSPGFFSSSVKSQVSSKCRNQWSFLLFCFCEEILFCDCVVRRRSRLESHVHGAPGAGGVVFTYFKKPYGFKLQTGAHKKTLSVCRCTRGSSHTPDTTDFIFQTHINGRTLHRRYTAHIQRGKHEMPLRLTSRRHRARSEIARKLGPRSRSSWSFGLPACYSTVLVRGVESTGSTASPSPRSRHRYRRPAPHCTAPAQSPSPLIA